MGRPRNLRPQLRRDSLGGTRRSSPCVVRLWTPSRIKSSTTCVRHCQTPGGFHSSPWALPSVASFSTDAPTRSTPTAPASSDSAFSSSAVSALSSRSPGRSFPTSPCATTSHKAIIVSWKGLFVSSYLGILVATAGSPGRFRLPQGQCPLSTRRPFSQLATTGQLQTAEGSPMACGYVYSTWTAA